MSDDDMWNKKFAVGDPRNAYGRDTPEAPTHRVGGPKGTTWCGAGGRGTTFWSSTTCEDCFAAERSGGLRTAEASPKGAALEKQFAAGIAELRASHIRAGRELVPPATDEEKRSASAQPDDPADLALAKAWLEREEREGGYESLDDLAKPLATLLAAVRRSASPTAASAPTDDGLHTLECVEAAAKTRRSFCIAPCADARRRRASDSPLTCDSCDDPELGPRIPSEMRHCAGCYSVLLHQRDKALAYNAKLLQTIRDRATELANERETRQRWEDLSHFHRRDAEDLRLRSGSAPAKDREDALYNEGWNDALDAVARRLKNQDAHVNSQWTRDTLAGMHLPDLPCASASEAKMSSPAAPPAEESGDPGGGSQSPDEVGVPAGLAAPSSGESDEERAEKWLDFRFPDVAEDDHVSDLAALLSDVRHEALEAGASVCEEHARRAKLVGKDGDAAWHAYVAIRDSLTKGSDQ